MINLLRKLLKGTHRNGTDPERQDYEASLKEVEQALVERRRRSMDAEARLMRRNPE